MRVVREVHEVAALDRLHDDDGLAEFAADLVASAALHGGIVVVEVVELDLHDLNLRIVRQDITLARGNQFRFRGVYIRKTDPLTAYRYFPVMLSGLARMSSGVPQATMRPPASPPPGPMSMM